MEPICKALQVAPTAYRRDAARHRNPALLPAQARRDPGLLSQVQRVYEQNLQVYVADKVWRQLRREGTAAARCTVERLMCLHGLQGARRGKAVRTTVPDAKAAHPLDWVNRRFNADLATQLWVVDFTYVSTWQGFVYGTFVIDVFARRIAGWRVSSPMQTDFALDALEQALSARRAGRDGGLVHHSDSSLQPAPASATAGGWLKPTSSPRLAVPATAMTTRWPRRSTGCSRPRSSTGAGSGRVRSSSTRRLVKRGVQPHAASNFGRECGAAGPVAGSAVVPIQVSIQLSASHRVRVVHGCALDGVAGQID